MAKRLASALAGLVLLAGCALAPPAPGPALYVVTDADSTMYLFGTVHLRRPGDPWGGPAAQAALAQSDQVWTEIAMTPEADAHGQQLVLQHGIAPEGEPLSRLLTPEEKARLDALAARYGMAPAALDRMRPWLAALTLSMLPIMQAGYDPSAGVDRAIDADADAAGKSRRALESLDQQIGFLSGFSAEAQHEMLLEAIDEAEEGAAQMDAMSAAWASGDVAALERYVIADTQREYPELYEIMFVQRNNAWMEILTQELEGSGVDFVAVGAGHLLGRDGLIQQFRRRGMRVERVRAGRALNPAARALR